MQHTRDIRRLLPKHAFRITILTVSLTTGLLCIWNGTVTAQAIGSLHHLVSVGVRVGVLGQGLDAGAGPGVALVHGSAQSQWGYPTQRRQCVSPSGGSVIGQAGLQGHDPRRKPM